VIAEPVDRFAADSAVSVLIFTSPKAGSGAGRDQIPRLVSLVRDHGVSVAIIETVAELKARVSEAARPLIVAAGGDGTLALAAQSVDADIPIAPMPLGTENLLARHFGHLADADAVLSTLRHGCIDRIDAGLANGRPFLIMASCGFDAEVVRGMHLTRGGHISRFSYARPILRAVCRYPFPQIQICIDGESSVLPPCHWCMVFNLPRYAAGLRIEPGAVADDGQLDLIAFQRGSVPSGLRYFAGVATGTHLKYRDVSRKRGVRFELTSPQRVPYQLDGDYVGRLPLRIETLPGRVCLLLPAQLRRRDR
jgi:diacylglycerol kinase family enzyme